MNKWQQQVYDMLRAASRNNLPCTIPADVTHIPANMMLEADRAKWICAKEKLPEKNGYYLCWVESSSVGKRKEYEHRKLYWEENLWLSSAKSFKTEHPLYWMSLPEPPKMGGGAENG